MPTDAGRCATPPPSAPRKGKKRLIRVGFTGTQDGMTDYQKAKLSGTLLMLRDRYETVEFYHGDCIGADAEAHDIAALLLGVENIYILPSNVKGKRAYCKSPHIMPEDNPLDRNETIVHVTDVLIACPKEPREVMRSGTWATVRRAQRYKKYFRVIPPQELAA